MAFLYTQKLKVLSNLLVTINFMLLVNLASLPLGKGHIASLFDDGGEEVVRLGRYTFRIHPKKGEVKPPLYLQHSREARGPLLHSQNGLGSDVTRLPFLRHPSFTHKFLSSARLSKLHQPIHSSLREPDLPPSEANFERFLTKLSASRGGAGFGGDTNIENMSKEIPTFTPYISARALTNMEKFFHHLRENLEALQKGESEDSEGDGSGTGSEDEDESSGSPGKAMASGYQLPASSLHTEWKPRASGILGLKKIRSFFPLTPNAESRSRLGTNLGLGRKR